MFLPWFQDLAKKFNETTQYKNMKQMLTSKNDQIKELRGRLRKWVKKKNYRYLASSICYGRFDAVGLSEIQ